MSSKQYDNKEIKRKQIHTSPILHRLLASSTKSNEYSLLTDENELIDNDKSPQYRPRYSPFYQSNAKIYTPQDYLNQ